MTQHRSAFGSVRRLPSGRYQARYTDLGGVRQTAPGTFATKSDARRFLASIETDLERGTWRDPRLGRITFAEWVDEYLDNAVHLRPRTRDDKRAVLARRFVPVFGRMPLATITRRDVARVVATMTSQLAPSTVATEVGVLRAALEAAVDAEIIPSNPARKPKLPENPDKEAPRATLAQLALLAEHIDARYSALVWLAGTCGLRWNELAAIRVRSLDFLSRPPAVHVVESLDGPYLKTDAAHRTVPMAPQVAELLAAHLARWRAPIDPDARVFAAPQGGDLRSYENFLTRRWQPAVKRAAAIDPALEGFVIHGLRHSAAGWWRSLGLHTQLIARWLGHTNDRITSRRYGWVPDALDVDGAARAADAFAAHLNETVGATGSE